MIAGTRAWLRKITSTPELKEQVEAALKASVARGDLSDYWKAIEHGFGRAPMSMDVRVDDKRDETRRVLWHDDGLFAEVDPPVSTSTTH